MSQHRLAKVILAVSLLAGGVLRLLPALTDHGIFWPDEIYQSFEPAHRLVFGYGLMPWEFIDGARSWAFPGLVAGLIKFSTLFIGQHSTAYIEFVKVIFALMSVAASLGAARLARSFSADALTASIASVVASFAGVSIYFGHRAMSENAAAVTMVWGLALVLDRQRSKKLLVVGASLLGLSVLFRLQMALCCVGVVMLLVMRREWRPLLMTTGVLAVWAMVLGALDAVTWHDVPNALYGGWFHSAVVYVRFNIIEGRGAGWGTSPWWFYFSTFWSSMPTVSIAFVVGALLSLRTARGLLLISLLFLALHSWSPHKEIRFLVPLLPVLAALVATGVSALPWQRVRSGLMLAVALASITSAVTQRHFTMGELGAYADRPHSAAWGDYAPVNRLMHHAGTREDLCGLMIGVAHLAWVGGSTYLHKPVPLYMPGMTGNGANFNYAIVSEGSGAEVIAKDSGLELIRTQNQPCQPDPGYSWRLP